MAVYIISDVEEMSLPNSRRQSHGGTTVSSGGAEILLHNFRDRLSQNSLYKDGGLFVNRVYSLFHTLLSYCYDGQQLLAVLTAVIGMQSVCSPGPKMYCSESNMYCFEDAQPKGWANNFKKLRCPFLKVQCCQLDSYKVWKYVLQRNVHVL
jgi:hypothetical protein